MYIPTFFCFICGACFGSFLNVLVWRLPRQESPILPRSYCPSCKVGISIFDNIPIISWILLRGQCRSCRNPISFTYPIVELSTALLFVACKFNHNINGLLSNDILYLFAGWIFLTVILSLSLVDLQTLWLPQSLISTGYILGLMYILIKYLFVDYSINLILDHLFAGFLSYFFFEIIRLIAFKLLSKEALGKGDSKFISMVAIWLGLSSSYLCIVFTFVASAIFTLTAIYFRKLQYGQQFPLGPFIGSSAFIIWILGAENIFESLLK